MNRNKYSAKAAREADAGPHEQHTQKELPYPSVRREEAQQAACRKAREELVDEQIKLDTLKAQLQMTLVKRKPLNEELKCIKYELQDTYITRKGRRQPWLEGLIENVQHREQRIANRRTLLESIQFQPSSRSSETRADCS